MTPMKRLKSSRFETVALKPFLHPLYTREKCNIPLQKPGFFGMQQFSFNPAPFNILHIFYNILQRKLFTLKRIRINGNFNPLGIQ